MHTGAFSADGMTAGERRGAAEKLHKEIAQWHVTLMVVQALQHMHHAYDPRGRGYQPVRECKYDGSNNRDSEMHRRVQNLKGLVREIGHIGVLNQIRTSPERDNHQPCGDAAEKPEERKKSIGLRGTKMQTILLEALCAVVENPFHNKVFTCFPSASLYS